MVVSTIWCTFAQYKTGGPFMPISILMDVVTVPPALGCHLLHSYLQISAMEHSGAAE